MAEAAGHDLIVVRRHEEDEHEAHSSAWKVALADFMTALMTFFLIMWLINVTDDQVRKGISEYFNPIHLSQGRTELKGLNTPDSSPDKTGGKRGHADSAAQPFNPLELSQGHADEKSVEQQPGASPAMGSQAAGKAAEGQATGGAAADGEDSAATEGQESAEGPAIAAGIDSGEARELLAFQDPYAVLADLADEYAVWHATSTIEIPGDVRRPGLIGGEADRDPFDPVYWQLAEIPPARSVEPGEPGSAPSPPRDLKPDAAAAANPSAEDPIGSVAGAEEPLAAASPSPESSLSPEQPGEPSETAASPQAPSPPPAEAAVAAQEKAPTGPAPAGADPPQPEPSQAKPAPDVVEAESRATAELVNQRLADAIRSLAGDASPLISVRATGDGVLIDLTDDADFSMFAVGSAVPDGKVVVLMEKIAKILADLPGQVIVRGHTDGRPFRSEVYDNWRLSSARAHMAYYMLTRGGLSEQRVLRVEGYADRALKVPDDPLAAENRRIEIFITRSAE